MSMSPVIVKPTIRFDPVHIKTLPGILKASEVILNLLGFICVVLPPFEVYARWYYPVALTGFLVSVTFLTLYLFHVTDQFHKIPWIKIDIVSCGIWMICNLVAGIFLARIAGHSTALCAATVFAFSVMVVYGVDGFFKFTGLKT